jgi:hypothetical protein
MSTTDEFHYDEPDELDDFINYLELKSYVEEYDITYCGKGELYRPYVPAPQPLPRLGGKLVARTTIAALESIAPAENNVELRNEANRVFSTTTLESLVNKHLPPREYVLAPIIPERGLAMLFASRGVGKTHVGLGIAYAVASGGPFLRWHAPKPRRVLYIDGEMPEVLLQERSKALKESSNVQPPSEDYFTYLAMDCQTLGTTINLADQSHQIIIDGILDNFEFVVIDNISTLVSGGRENDAASWDKMQAWLLQLRRRGITVLLIHHTGRGENARGTSKREDVLDTVMLLKRPVDYKMAEGARFEVHLTRVCTEPRRCRVCRFVIPGGRFAVWRWRWRTCSGFRMSSGR